jgi:hypothetical protein
MKKAAKWIIDQLKQPSTWRGITMLATSLGIAINPQLMEQIVVAGTAVAGLIGVLFKG